MLFEDLFLDENESGKIHTLSITSLVPRFIIQEGFAMERNIDNNSMIESRLILMEFYIKTGGEWIVCFSLRRFIKVSMDLMYGKELKCTYSYVE